MTDPSTHWQPIETAPLHEVEVNLLFDILDSDPGLPETYAPGCTDPEFPAKPIIKNVKFMKGYFTPVSEDGGEDLSKVLGVKLTHWCLP